MFDELVAVVKRKMESDHDFASALKQAKSQEEAVAIVRGAGIVVSDDVIASRELSTSELENISGGSWYGWWGARIT